MLNHFASNKSLGWKLVLLACILLVACGTLEVGLEGEMEPDAFQTEGSQVPVTPQTAGDSISTARPDTGTKEPVTVDPEDVFEFVNYAHPRFGYQIPVPNGAQVDQSADGLTTTFTYDDGMRRFILSIAVYPELPDPVSDSPAAFLRWATVELNGSPEPESEVTPVSVDDGNLIGAMLYEVTEDGVWCSQLRVQHTAFIANSRGYLITIRSDAPNLCDAEAIPESDPVLSSFRVEEGDEIADVAPTLVPTPVPADTTSLLRVAFAKEGNVQLWTEGSGSVALTKNGGVESVLLSSDGQRIAFRRGGNVWVVNSDGSNERQLTTEVDFEGISFGEDLDPYVLAVVPYQLAWRPGTHTLYFNTSPQFEGPGLMLSDDLWSIDADTGEILTLLPPGEGGRFHISPDGRAVALVTPGSISLLDLDSAAGSGSLETKQLLTYAPVITYSEVQFYAEPAWASDSSLLAVAIPPVDWMASPDQLTSLWYLYPDGSSPRLMGHVQPSSLSTGRVLFTPELDRALFLVDGPGGPERVFQVAISQIGESGVEETDITPVQAEIVDSWAPDGIHYVFTPPYDGQTPARFIGSLDSEPIPVGDEGKTVFMVTWVDETRYLFTQLEGRGWTILLAELGSEDYMAIDGVVGAPPQFDVVD